jgi:hypothetical protein
MTTVAVLYNKNNRGNAMKNSKLLALLCIVCTFYISNSLASEHHSGHGASKNSSGTNGSANTCGKPNLDKFLPPHLATVSPGSEFSFLVFNINNPEQIAVTVKNIPIEIKAEFKDPFYLVKGKIPASLVNTAARINIKVSAKSPHCEVEAGWLLKIADK